MAANNLHQVSRELPWVDPIDAAALLSDGLLLDGRGQHPDARYAFLGLHHQLEASLHGDQWTIVDAIGTTCHGEPVKFLRELTTKWQFDWQEKHPFTGGFIGYFGYESARIFEPTLPAPKSNPSTPDAILRLCFDALVFDHQQRTITAYAADADQASATARLENYATKITGAVEAAPVVATKWSTNFTQEEFEAQVERVKALIHNGDLFQANIATRFEAPFAARPIDVFRHLANANPSPYMALMRFAEWSLVSCSPELLFSVDGPTISTRPIAGTRGRGADTDEDEALEMELVRDPKERAEHTMLVDLLRNDIAQVSQPGTTRVTEAMSVERYQHVMHLVSCVSGNLRRETDFVDCMAALFPGGTITGAPKHRACLRIHESEPVPRGPYTGSAGFLSWSGNATWNILIRTLVMQNGRASVHAGSGVVADSKPASEWFEAHRKAASLIAPASAPASRVGEVTKHGSWEPTEPNRAIDARVLLIDNFDSFVHNLADYAAAVGATVRVVRNDENLAAAVADFEPTHMILGPGPGWPDESGCTLDAAANLGLPTLGVCLGHQALAQVHGGKVLVGEAVHGKTSDVYHDEQLLGHLPSPFSATRYHSLIVEIPAGWHKSAWLKDGTIMAMRHPELPVWGLQFHPESFCTQGGLEIIMRFLESKWTA